MPPLGRYIHLFSIPAPACLLFFVLWRVETECAEFQSEESGCCPTLANHSTTRCDKNQSWMICVWTLLKQEIHLKSRCTPTHEDSHVVNRNKKVLWNLSLLLWPYEDIKPCWGWKLHTRSAAMWCSKSKTAKNHNDRLDDVHVHPFELVTPHKLSEVVFSHAMPSTLTNFFFGMFAQNNESNEEKSEFPT